MNWFPIVDEFKIKQSFLKPKYPNQVVKFTAEKSGYRRIAVRFRNWEAIELSTIEDNEGIKYYAL